MKSIIKALAGIVVLTSTVSVGWLTLSAAPPANNTGVSNGPQPGVSTNLPYGASTNLPSGVTTNLPPGASNKQF